MRRHEMRPYRALITTLGTAPIPLYSETRFGSFARGIGVLQYVSHDGPLPRFGFLEKRSKGDEVLRTELRGVEVGQSGDEMRHLMHE